MFFLLTKDFTSCLTSPFVLPSYLATSGFYRTIVYGSTGSLHNPGDAVHVEGYVNEWPVLYNSKVIQELYKTGHSFKMSICLARLLTPFSSLMTLLSLQLATYSLCHTLTVWPDNIPSGSHNSILVAGWALPKQFFILPDLQPPWLTSGPSWFHAHPVQPKFHGLSTIKR